METEMTKEEMVQFLKDHGVKAGMQYGEELLKTMIAELPKDEAEKTVEQEGIRETGEDEEPKIPMNTTEKTVEIPVENGSFNVMKKGKLMRTYSEHIHGKSASAYATEFAQKFGGTVVSS